MNKTEKWNLSRRELFVRAAQFGVGAGVLSALSPLGASPITAAPSREEVTIPEGLPPGWLKPVKLGLSIHTVGAIFVVPILTGFADVCEMLPNIEEYQIAGPPTLDPVQQIAGFEAMVEKGFDGIAVAMCHEDAWIEPTKLAAEKGVQIVTTDCDAPAASRDMFFGVEWESAGRTLGDLGAAALGGEGGQAVTFDCCPGCPSNLVRRTSAEKRLEELGVDVVDTIALGQSEMENYEGIENYMAGHPEINLMVGGCGYDTSNAALYAQNKDNRDLKAVGWDCLPRTMELIKEGWLYGSINCNPYAYGFMTAMSLWEKCVLGVPWPDLPKQHYPTGVEVVNADNIDTVYAREMRFY